MISKLMCVPKQNMITVLSSHQIADAQVELIRGGNGGGTGSSHNDNDEVTKG